MALSAATAEARPKAWRQWAPAWPRRFVLSTVGPQDLAANAAMGAG
jgi:hypothetical protein